MAKKILFCDRCQFQVTDEANIEIALAGRNAWVISARVRGAEARGVIPCKNFIRCGGEMILTKPPKK